MTSTRAHFVRFLALGFLTAALPAGAHTPRSTSLRNPTLDGLRDAVRIGERELGLAGGARFGSAVASIGDLDGDGHPDLAVGSSADAGGVGGSRRGAVWILFLNKDGTVRSSRKITSGTAGFTGPLANDERFGTGVALVGDLDHDGHPELAVGAPGAGANKSGAVWLLSLEKDGSVKAEKRIATGLAGFPETLHAGDAFGFSVAGPGDLDGDGAHDLVVGSPYAQRTGDGHGVVWSLRLSASGDVLGSRRIHDAERGFTAFGTDVAAAGDLDGDGRSELAIGAPRAGNARSGAVWLLFLDHESRVRRRVRIASDEGGFGGALEPGAAFGAGLTAAPDIDGDGVPDLAVGAPASGAEREGALWLLLLRSDGTVRAQERIDGSTTAIASGIDAYDAFGQSLTSLGDLDGDGRPDLTVGAWNTGRGGAVWNVFLGGCFAASAATRDGYGVNPRILSTEAPPRAGARWDVTLDCTAQLPGIATIVGSSRAVFGRMTGAGELLIDPSPGARVFTLTLPHAGDAQTASVTLPADLSFCDFALYVQGTCATATEATLSNALDLVVGR